MIEVNASFQSVKTSVSSLQAQYKSNSLAYQKGSNDKSLGFLNTQENQIADEVDISQQAIKALEEARALSDFLQNYLDYLNGNNSTISVSISPVQEQNTGTQIASRSTELSASITKVSYEEENLELTARFTDEGQLQELIVEKSSLKAEYLKAEISLKDTQFYASL